MLVIDADTHVDENEDTWKKLEGTPYARYIPVTISMPPDEAERAGYNPTNSRCWVVEGRLQNRAIRDDINHPPRIFRELQDVAGRVAHMDKMGVAVQVIFPTFFIRYNTKNAEAEWALTTTYNRWLADFCAEAPDRFRGVAYLPMRDVEESIGFLRFNADGAARFRREVERMMHSSEGTLSWYLRAIHHIAVDPASEVLVTAIDGMEWGEVDFPEDVAVGERLTAGWLAKGR